MNSRDLQAKATKKNIYNTFVNLLNKKNFKNISISKICERADVSIGTFYYYYDSKQSILFEVYKKADVYLKNNIEPVLNSENSMENLRKYLISYIKYVKSDGLDMLKHLYVPDNKFFVKKRAMQKILKNIITDGQDKNQISKRMPPEKAVDFIFTILRGVVFDWCLHDGQYNIIDYSQHFIEYICEYFSVKN